MWFESVLENTLCFGIMYWINRSPTWTVVCNQTKGWTINTKERLDTLKFLPKHSQDVVWWRAGSKNSPGHQQSGQTSATVNTDQNRYTYSIDKISYTLNLFIGEGKKQAKHFMSQRAVCRWVPWLTRMRLIQDMVWLTDTQTEPYSVFCLFSVLTSPSQSPGRQYTGSWTLSMEMW